MAERRDSKNRILEKGEYQKTDGRYMYRYTDANGKACFVYSWTLTQSDRTPKGKTPGPCLRELEKKIARDLQDQIITRSKSRMTLNAFYRDYMEQKYKLKPSTKSSYQCMYRKYVEDSLGRQNIANIRYSDVKKFYNDLVQNGAMKPSSLGNIHNVLHPIFATAVRDGYVRLNPATGVLDEIKNASEESDEKRHPLTTQQQALLVECVRASRRYNRWAPILIVLLGTGGRIGEVAGLTWQDCDFENELIYIRRNLQYYYTPDTGTTGYHISTPKTARGIRVIPMLSQVKEALLEEKKRQETSGGCMMEIDGYSGFIFTTRNHTPVTSLRFNSTMAKVVKEYNASELAAAEEQGRPPALLPEFTAHNLRHTFCTRMCENVTNLKVVQDIMGHAHISTTMDIYAEASLEKKQAEFARLDSQLKLVTSY